MKKLITLVLFVLLSMGAYAQNYYFNSYKAVVLDKESNTSKTVTNHLVLVWTVVKGEAITGLTLSSGAKFYMTEYKEPNSNHYIFKAFRYDTEAGMAYVHFYFNGKHCTKIVIDWTDFKFTYYIE